MTWLTRSTDYSTALAGSTFSPSRSVASFTNSDSIDPIAPHTDDRARREDDYWTKAESFVRRTLDRATAVAASWTGEAVEATTSVHPGARQLFVSGAGILARGMDPDGAADYATGRVLIAASQREYMTAGERTTAWERDTRYRSIGMKSPGRAEADRNYAASHLARTIATVRGREAVLSEWPGWAGYFAAAEADRVSDEVAAAFVANEKAPEIVRAAFALGREAEGLPVPMPAEIAALVDLGRPHLERRWAKGSMMDRADAAIAAMLPPPSADPTGAMSRTPGEGEGEEQEQEQPAGWTEADTEAEAEPVPMDPGRAAMPDPRADEPLNVNTRAEPRKPTAPGSGLAKPAAGTRRYRVEECPARPADPDTLRRMIESARPLVAALGRIAWETDRPDECDRGQENGAIDEGAMHRLAAFGDFRVFERPQEQNRATVAVHVLIDCSGSMGAGVNSDPHETRIGASRTVGYALATAFGRNPRYRVAVSGHDVAYMGDARVRFHRCKDANAIAGLQAGGDNADGYAIEHAFRLVERERADRRIVFLIADGQPAADGYGNAAKHIQSVIGAAAARGMDFLAVGIEGTIRPATGRALFGSRFVNLDATRSAGPLLARVIARMARGGQP